VVFLVQLLRALGSFVLSALISLVAFGLISAALVWILTITNRGGDSIMVLVGSYIGVPLVFGAQLVLMVWLTVVFYRRFSKTSKGTK
jgi:hypothetical protein